MNDEYNEARESFVVVIDQNITIPEEVPEFLRDGIALITIVDNDRKQIAIIRIIIVSTTRIMITTVFVLFSFHSNRTAV